MTNNSRLLAWVHDMAALCKPDRVHWCDGSQEESNDLWQLLFQRGTLVLVGENRFPGCYLCRPDPADVACLEDRTFICSKSREDAGPNNNWCEAVGMKAKLMGLFYGSMRGRTMYVLPFCLGPLGSPLGRIGVALTDSPYVVVNIRIMTHMGSAVLDLLGNTGEFVPCLHSVGMPLGPGQKDVPWPCNADNKYIVHFPEEQAIWSYGSGYGGNALLGKKCFALGITSVMAGDDSPQADLRRFLRLIARSGEKKYIAAVFPRACRKSILAMLTAALPGWKVEFVGGDIAWMRLGDDDLLRDINPKTGSRGVAPGTSAHSDPNALETATRHSIFASAAMTPDGDMRWEDLKDDPSSPLAHRTGEERTPKGEHFEFGPLRIWPEVCVKADGAEVALGTTNTERLFVMLVSAMGAPVHKREIEDLLWPGGIRNPKAIPNEIHRLRVWLKRNNLHRFVEIRDAKKKHPTYRLSLVDCHNGQ